MCLLISFRESTLPQFLDLLFAITNENIKWTVYGGVDFLKLVNRYIVLDKNLFLGNDSGEFTARQLFSPKSTPLATGYFRIPDAQVASNSLHMQ